MKIHNTTIGKQQRNWTVYIFLFFIISCKETTHTINISGDSIVVAKTHLYNLERNYDSLLREVDTLSRYLSYCGDAVKELSKYAPNPRDEPIKIDTSIWYNYHKNK